MSFPSSSPFYREPVVTTPEKIREGIDARSRESASFINIEQHVLEDWVTELRDQADDPERDFESRLASVSTVADEIDAYLDR